VAKLFIHAGLPKTGTTYLQNCFEWLAKQAEFKSVRYPLPKEHRSFHDIHSGNAVAIGQYLSARVTPVFLEHHLRQKVAALLDKVRIDERPVLISSEFLATPPADRLEILVQCLRGRGFEPEVIVVVRPLVELFFSAFSQCVKRDCVGTSFEQWVSQGKNRLAGSYIKSILAYQLPVHVLPYEPQGLLGSVLNVIGEDASLSSKVPQATVNRSLTRSELDLLVRINQQFTDARLATRISNRLIREFPDLAPATINASELQAARHTIATAEPPFSAYTHPVEKEMARLFLDEPAMPPPLVPACASDSALIDGESLSIALTEIREHLANEQNRAVLGASTPALSRQETTDELKNIFRPYAMEFRELARTLEPFDMNAALDMMQFARLGRPGGEAIINRIAFYEQQLRPVVNRKTLRQGGVDILSKHLNLLNQLAIALETSHPQLADALKRYAQLCK
jgi:hypothetical protein